MSKTAGIQQSRVVVGRDADLSQQRKKRRKRKKRKNETVPFSVHIMRSQRLYQAAHSSDRLKVHAGRRNGTCRSMCDPEEQQTPGSTDRHPGMDCSDTVTHEASKCLLAVL